MKKLLIGMVAVAAIIAFAAPAFAAATVHVRALTDIGWQSKSEELTNSGDTATRMFMNLPGHDYLKVLWVSDDKTTGAHVEFSIVERDNGNNSEVNLRYLYGWYEVGNCRFLAGHDDNWFGSLAYSAKQVLGLTTSAKLLLLGNGAMYSSRMPQARFEWKTNGYGFMIAAVTPGGAMRQWNPTIVDVATGATVATPDMASVLPRIDVSFLFRAGGFQTTPGFSWSMQKYQWADAYDDFEDSVTTWAAFLPARFSMGGFTVKFQFHFGQNYDYEYFHGLGAANANGQPISVAYPDGDSVENTHMMGGALSFEYEMGNMGFYAGGGVMNYQNDLWDNAAFDSDSYTRYMIYAGMQYNFNKHFYIHPEISYTNYGSDIVTGDDAGVEWLFGAQVGFLF